jgi:subtilisin family serine protease
MSSAYLSEYAGRGVRIAVVDSGVHASHPHVRGVDGGVAIRSDGSLDDEYVDRVGHGTAVAAAVREKAPAAELVAVKIFWTTLATDVRLLVKGIEQACHLGATLVNLSLGTTNPDHRTVLEGAVRSARERGVVLVAAMDADGVPCMPGALEGVIGVQLDWTCPREAYRVVEANGQLALAASGFPRDIPNVPRHRNLSGISFAVANATGFLARALETSPNGTLPALWAVLKSGIPGEPAPALPK